MLNKKINFLQTAMQAN